MTVHFIANPAWSTITLCSADASGMGTVDESEVTCEECKKFLNKGEK